jgi:hypothetical protein
MLQKKVVHISKLDAAKRQLDFAIKSFFYDGDIVVRHTIIAAAHGILNDINTQIQGAEKSFVFNNQSVRKDKLKEFNGILKEAQNFFKHADYTGEETRILDFKPELTEFFIFDAVKMYASRTEEFPPLHTLYWLWFCKKHNDFLLILIRQKYFNKICQIFHLKTRPLIWWRSYQS